MIAISILDDSPQKDNYLVEAYNQLLRVEMHITKFRYSDDLTVFLECSEMNNTFAANLTQNKFYLLLAESIVYSFKSNKDRFAYAKQALQQLLASPNESFADKVLNKHGAVNTAFATPASLEYCKNLLNPTNN